MILDILFAVAMLLAIIKGWSKGFITGIFSFVALIVGAAAALKLSADLAIYLQKHLDQPSPLWPFVSFVIIFFIVALLVRLMAGLIEKTLQLAMLGWFNRLAGIGLYILTYAILFSILLWLADRMMLLPETIKTDSRVYSWIAPLGPGVIDFTGRLIPWFKDIFHQLEEFFDHLSPLIK